MESGYLENLSYYGPGTQWPLSQSHHDAIGTYLVIVGTLGSSLNCLVIAMFLKFHSLMSPTHLLLLNLSIADLGMSIMGGFPFSAPSSFAGKWIYGDGGCQYYAFMGFLFGTANIANLFAIAVDRYLVTDKLSRGEKTTYKRYGLMLVGIWVYSLFWSIMPLLGWASYNYEPSFTTCTIDWRNNNASYKSYLIVYTLLTFVIPIIIMSVCYYKAATCIKRQTQNKSFLERWADEKNVTMMCVLLMIAFVVFWSPYAILTLWTVVWEPHTVPYVIAIMPPLVAKSSPMLDPIIFYLTNPRLRQGMIATVTCGDLPVAEIKKGSKEEMTAMTDKKKEDKN